MHCCELCGIVPPALHEVLCLSHLGKADVVYGSVAYLPDCLDELLAGKPTVRQGIMGAKTALPHAMKHLYGRVHLAHAAFLFPLIRRSFLHALLGESAAERLLPQSSVSFLPQFLMDGEVERQGGLAVEEQARQQLVAQDVVLTHMVEHPGDMFQFPTVFFPRWYRQI